MGVSLKKKNKCNKKAGYAGAMIYALLENFLEGSEKLSPMVVRLKMMLLKELRTCPIFMAAQADRAFENVAEEIKNKGYKLSVATVIDTLYFNFEPQMRSMYGNKIGEAITSFTIRFAPDVDGKIATDSYAVADMLSKAFEDEATSTSHPRKTV